MSEQVLRYATHLLESSAAALRRVSFGEQLIIALALIEKCKGRIIVTGIGKSGIVARKLAATMSSLGRPAYFLHAAEAVHGDLGMIARHDCVIMISNSGKTAELSPVILHCDRFAIPTIAIVGDAQSMVAESASAILCYGHVEDPCVGAPTASALVAMAVGDVLASCMTIGMQITVDNFKEFHPGGALGDKDANGSGHPGTL